MKRKIKDLLARVVANFNYPLLVNSYGRSGSSLLVSRIKKDGVRFENINITKISHTLMFTKAWDLDKQNFKKGIVYKTHDYPPEEISKNIRMLYTFSDPIDVVLSLLRLYKIRGEGWMRNHYEHLKVPFTNFNNIIHKDQLNIERHLNSWLNEDRFPIAFIRYETMWDYEYQISNFLGFHFRLPPYRARKANSYGNKELISEIEKTYGSFQKKINKLGNFFTN